MNVSLRVFNLIAINLVMLTAFAFCYLVTVTLLVESGNGSWLTQEKDLLQQLFSLLSGLEHSHLGLSLHLLTQQDDRSSALELFCQNNGTINKSQTELL